MPNKGNPNYRSGRAFEYETMREWESKGCKCIRASGSHGEFDVIAYRPDHPPTFIQCKKVATVAQADRLMEAFRENTCPSRYYHQQLFIKVLRVGTMGVTV